MLVRSTPANAVVLVNGVERGRTPVAIRNLQYGTYRVAVSLPGYGVEEREVALSQEIPASAMTFTLQAGSPQVGAAEPEPGPATPEAAGAGSRPEAPPASALRTSVDTRSGTAGSLDIASLPRGARVFLNGQPVGVTPMRISGLAPGPHTIRLEQSGYRSWTDTVTAVTARLTRVSASLEPAAPR